MSVTLLERRANDERLAAAAGAGSAAAFETLVEEYRLPLLRLAYRLVHDPDEANDIVQDVFLRAFRKIDDFRADRPFDRWLYAIARNAAFDSLRRRRRATAFAQREDALPGSAPGPEELAVRDDEAMHIHDALGALPERYREALELYYVHDLRYREIAETLGIPLGTVKTFISRAKRKLRDDLRVRSLAA
ncbi:MAG: RNA polymerase sigma factor [Vulcanimicrobiaceae bacterium]